MALDFFVQELAKCVNGINADYVIGNYINTDEDGTKHIDTKELTLEQMAIITDLEKRISKIEKILGDK